MNNSFSRLVLGTAQLGSHYGIANKTGKPNHSLAIEIVKEAWENGIREFDTAQGYGESEEVLGKAINNLGIKDDVKIISKFDPQLDHLDIDTMNRMLDESLQKLGIQKLYGIMLHREELLTLWNMGLSEIFFSFVAMGKIKKIGVSVYSPDKAIEALNTDGIDMIQIPTNIIDRRFERRGVFEFAQQKEKEIYIRSVFLQGLLLMNIEAIPGKISYVIPVLERFERLSKELGLTRHEIALGYIKSAIPSAKVIFGAETKEQIKENVSAWQKDFPQFLCKKIKINFSDIDDHIVDPRLW